MSNFTHYSIKTFCLTGSPALSLGYIVKVGNKEETCATAPVTGNNSVNLTCGQPLVGQYLELSRKEGLVDSNGGNYLILCEVIVWGVRVSYIKLGM